VLGGLIPLDSLYPDIQHHVDHRTIPHLANSSSIAPETPYQPPTLAPFARSSHLTVQNHVKATVVSLMDPLIQIPRKACDQSNDADPPSSTPSVRDPCLILPGDTEQQENAPLILPESAVQRRENASHGHTATLSDSNDDVRHPYNAP
jgi:hypothetical protein